MKKRRRIKILAGLMALMIASLACGINLPGGLSQVDTIATQVAATLAAMLPSPAVPVTPEPHDLPTQAPTEIEPTDSLAPLSLAFVGPDRNAYYWNESLSGVTQLTTSGDVDGAYVSSDGTLVAITRTPDWYSYNLDVVYSDGSNMRTLVSPAGFAALPHPEGSVGVVPYQVNWVPGSQTLAFNTRITYEGPGLRVGNNLYLLDTANGSMRSLLSVATSWQYYYSPDGSRIAVARPEGMDLYDADGNILSSPVITYDRVNTASEYEWVAHPAWSSDSTRLAVVIPPKEPWTETPEDSVIFHIALDPLFGEQTIATPMIFFPDDSASFSPDLSMVTFFTRYGPPTDNMFTIKLANIDSTTVVDYAVGHIAGAPVWSPDNNRFVYYDRDTGAWLGQVGSTPSSMAELGNVRSIHWVDENRFIVASGPEGGWRLLLATIGAPTGVIYSTPVTSDFNLEFTINR